MADTEITQADIFLLFMPVVWMLDAAPREVFKDPVTVATALSARPTDSDVEIWQFPDGSLVRIMIGDTRSEVRAVK